MSEMNRYSNRRDNRVDHHHNRRDNRMGYHEYQEQLDIIRMKEDALDRWEMDLRRREDILRGQSNHTYIHRTRNVKKPRINKEKDYSKLAAPREETNTPDEVNDASC